MTQNHADQTPNPFDEQQQANSQSTQISPDDAQQQANSTLPQMSEDDAQQLANSTLPQMSPAKDAPVDPKQKQMAIIRGIFIAVLIGLVVLVLGTCWGGFGFLYKFRR